MLEVRILFVPRSISEKNSQKNYCIFPYHLPFQHMVISFRTTVHNPDKKKNQNLTSHKQTALVAKVSVPKNAKKSKCNSTVKLYQ